MRIIAANERYDAKFNYFVTEAQCPFCAKISKVSDGVLFSTCEHYIDRAHGCGGGVFTFNDEE